MEGCLAVDVVAVHIHFVVVEQCDCIVDVSVRYRMKHNVVTDLFDLSDHFYNYQTDATGLGLG